MRWLPDAAGRRLTVVTASWSGKTLRRIAFLVKEKYPFFTSRDVRNIQKMVSGRILDFDLEPSWLDEPEEFFLKDYETKKNMLIELMKANMKGLSFAEIRLQETIKYLDNMVKIATAEERREIEQTARRIVTHSRATDMAQEMLKS